MTALNFLAKGQNNNATLQGDIRVPGDKSISHRSIMFASMAKGTSHIQGFLEGEDAFATLNAFTAMGVDIEGPKDGKVTVHGVGMQGLKAPGKTLDMGNSGTSIRLLAGLLAGLGIEVELSGDVSLSKRPMRRVTDPLALMGANIETNDAGTPPLKIHPVKQLNAINYELPMASAQVKSCVLLAGLFAEGKTTVTEPAPTRDHTERMLEAFGYPVEVDGPKRSVVGGSVLQAANIDIPADISSAAFFMVAASIAKDADVTLRHVGINPTRIGIINILQKMGGDITLMNERQVGGEPVADIRVKSANLTGIVIDEDDVPLAIDELPVVFVAAAAASGQTVLTGAEELRVKESDRIQVMADGLNAIGVNATPTDDGMIIDGGNIVGGEVESHHDHRISMSFAVASLISSGEIFIKGCENVATSFPTFFDLANQLGFNLKVVSHD